MGGLRTAIFEDNYLMWESYSHHLPSDADGQRVLTHMLNEWHSFADVYATALERFGYEVVRIVPSKLVREPIETKHRLGNRVIRLPVGQNANPAAQVLSFTHALLKELKHGYSLIHSLTLYSKFFVAYAPIVSQIMPVIAQYSGGEPPLNQGILNAAIWKTALHIAGTQCSAILLDDTLGPELMFQRWSLERYYRIPNRRIVQFPLVCVDTSLFFPKSKYDCRRRIECPDGKIVILCPTSILKPPIGKTGKNPFLLIEALGKLSPSVRDSVQLYIAGSGPGANDLSLRIRELGLQETVKLLGIVNHESLPDYYGACDGIFMPYLCRDLTLGTTVIESFACNRPVIGFRRDNTVAMKQKGGFLIDADSSGAARDLEHLLFELPFIEPGGDVQELVDRYSLINVSRRLAEIYATVIWH